MNRVDVAAGQIRHRLRVGRGPDRVARVVPAASAIGIGDLIRAGRRRRVRGLVAVGGAARKQCHVEEAELVAERAPRLLQVDHDPARPVVGVDSGDAALAGLGEPFGADDVRVEGRAGRAGPEERSTTKAKSEARTGLPSEYSRPGRRKSVYRLPPMVIFGRLLASAGISFVPAAPFPWA